MQQMEKRTRLSPIMFAYLTVPLLLFASLASANPSRQVLTFEENPVPLKNPMKGWRGVNDHIAANGARDFGNYIPSGSPHESLVKWYINWRFLEESADDAADRIERYMDHTFRDLPARGIKILPRLVCINHIGDQIPNDLPPLNNYRASPWYEKPEVQKRLARVIERLGQAWDHDPRVAFVQVGVQGKYGEQWDLGLMPEFEKFLHRHFHDALKNKKLMLRSGGGLKWLGSAELAAAGPYGFAQDSFAMDSYDRESEHILKLEGGKRWKVAPMGGEVRNYKNPELGADINSALETKNGRDQIERWIRRGHTTLLGLEQLIPIREDLLPHANKLHKLMGYRFLIEKADLPRVVNPGETADFTFSVKNTAVGKFYYDWPLKICFADPESKKIAWAATAENADLRDWNPDTTVTFTERLNIPADLPKKDYVVTLCVLDPEGGRRPGLRFAINNYWQGGHHPLAVIGVGEEPQAKLDSRTFFLDGIDSSLRYEVPGAEKRSIVFQIGKNDQQSREFPKWEDLTLPEGNLFQVQNLEASQHPNRLEGKDKRYNHLGYRFELPPEAKRLRLTLDLLQTSKSGKENRYQVLHNGKKIGAFQIERDITLRTFEWAVPTPKTENVLEIRATDAPGTSTMIDQIVLEQIVD